MVRGVWNIKADPMGSSYTQGWAGGVNDAQNSRDRYIKANSKGTPFGTTQNDNSQVWASTSRQNFKPVAAEEVFSQKIAGAPSR